MTGNFTIMAKETTYEEIARNLKNKIYSPVYFLMGEEDYYIDRISDYIMDTVLTETEYRIDYQCCQTLSDDVEIPGCHRQGSPES